jgi:hypothetical protein
MMVLPLGEAYTWLGQQASIWRWSLIGVLITLTIVVQLAAIGINLNTYFDRIRSKSTVYNDPSQSPIVVHWRQLSLQLNRDWNAFTQPGVTLQGWSHSEGKNNAQFPRLAGPHAAITITPRNTKFVFLRGDYINYIDKTCQMQLMITINQQQLSNTPACPARSIQILLPQRRTTITFDSEGVTVPGLPQHEWYSKLGITMLNLHVYDNDGDYPFWANMTPPSRMPALPNAMRIWASDIRTEFYDFWWYYLLAPPSSSPAWPVVVVIIVVIGGLALLAGIPHLRPGKHHQTAEQHPGAEPR